jgi:hypothetical protein
MPRKTTPKQDAAKASKPAKSVAKPPEILPAMTEGLFDEICDRIANGSSLLKLEKEEGFPARSTMQKWINATEDRRTAYDAARQDRADFRAEELDRINQKLEDGTIEPAAAREISANVRFQMSKEDPRRFGDKSQIELNVSRVPSDDDPEELRASILKTINSLPLLEVKDED